MKIKYKLISIFIIITLFALLPVSILQTRRQEEEKMAGLKRQGEIISQFLAHSVMNTILANGADFQASRIDVKETFSLLKSLAGDGLTFSEATLVSSNKNYRGFVLATFNDEKKPVPDGPLRNITPAELVRIKEPWSWFREIELPGRSGKYYEFTAVGFLPGNSPVCVCRMLYSEKIILEPIRKMRLITMIIVVLAIFFVALLGYIASRLISEPIVRLTNATQKIEDGDFSLNVPTQSNDEIGHLSRTINHMLRLIKTKIAELEDSNKRLLELDVLKDEFLANTSHELRTPLYGMVGIAESLVFGASGALNPDALYNIRMIIAS
ncbi:MAG TPA: HAMP domain-containing protein, partial [Spirochaetota bacterium]